MLTVRYRNLDIPTRERRRNEIYVESRDLFTSSSGTSPFGVQWTRYGEGSKLPQEVRNVPHVAFAVSDLRTALNGRRVLVPPFQDGAGSVAAFIEDNGAPVKLIQVDNLTTDEPDTTAPMQGGPAGLRYNSCWIPVKEKPRDKVELHLGDLQIFVVPHDNGPYRVGWVRYENERRYPDLVGRVPHVAFEVDDMEKAICGRKVIIEPNSPTPGLIVAFIEDDGAPIEFLQIDRTILKDGI